MADESSNSGERSDRHILTITITKSANISDVEDSFGTDPVGSPESSCSSGSGSVGEPGFWEGLTPIWGSGRQAINDFQNGRWGWGLVNSALAVTDLLLVKAIATGAIKLIGKTAGKEALEAVTREGVEAVAREEAELAARAITTRRGVFDIAKSAGPKLESVASKFGVTKSELVDDALENGKKFLDTSARNNGNINIFTARPDGKAGFFRITLDPSGKKIISAGLNQATNVTNGIASGRFIPLP